MLLINGPRSLTEQCGLYRREGNNSSHDNEFLVVRSASASCRINRRFLLSIIQLDEVVIPLFRSNGGNIPVYIHQVKRTVATLLAAWESTASAVC